MFACFRRVVMTTVRCRHVQMHPRLALSGRSVAPRPMALARSMSEMVRLAFALETGQAILQPLARLGLRGGLSVAVSSSSSFALSLCDAGTCDGCI